MSASACTIASAPSSERHLVVVGADGVGEFGLVVTRAETVVAIDIKHVIRPISSRERMYDKVVSALTEDQVAIIDGPKLLEDERLFLVEDGEE